METSKEYSYWIVVLVPALLAMVLVGLEMWSGLAFLSFGLIGWFIFEFRRISEILMKTYNKSHQKRKKTK